MIPIRKKNEILEQVLVDWRDSKNVSAETISIDVAHNQNCRLIELKEFGFPSPSAYFPFSSDPAFLLQQPKKVHGLNDLCMIDLGDQRRFVPIIPSFIEIKAISFDKDGKNLTLTISSSAWMLLSERYSIKIFAGGKGYSVSTWKKEQPIGKILIEWQNCGSGLWETLINNEKISSTFLQVVAPVSLAEWLSYINYAMQHLGHYHLLTKNDDNAKYTMTKVEGTDFLDLGKDNKIQFSKSGNPRQIIKISFVPSFLLSKHDSQFWSFESLDSNWISWTLTQKPWNQFEIWLSPKNYDGESMTEELNKAFSQPLFAKDVTIKFNDEAFVINSGFNTIDDVKISLKKFLYEHYLFAVTIDFDQATRTWIFEAQTPIVVDFGEAANWFGFDKQKYIAPNLIRGKPIDSLMVYSDSLNPTFEGKNLKNAAANFYYDKNSPIYEKFQMHNGSFCNLYKASYDQKSDSISISCSWTRWITFDKQISTRSSFQNPMKYEFPFFKDYQTNLGEKDPNSMEPNFSISCSFIPKLFNGNSSVKSISKWISPGQKLILFSHGFQVSGEQAKVPIRFRSFDQNWGESTAIVFTFNGEEYAIETPTRITVGEGRPPFQNLQLFNIHGQRINFSAGFYHGIFVIHSSQ